MAWILEKFHAWSDLETHFQGQAGQDAVGMHDRGGERLWAAYTKDELLTNISLYWFSNCITSSTRLYSLAPLRAPPHILMVWLWLWRAECELRCQVERAFLSVEWAALVCVCALCGVWGWGGRQLGTTRLSGRCRVGRAGA
jgi:hypothetical protein